MSSLKLILIDKSIAMLLKSMTFYTIKIDREDYCSSKFFNFLLKIYVSNQD